MFSKEFGTQTSRNFSVQQEKRCSVGNLYYANCPNFSTTFRDDLKYRITKNRSAPKPEVALKCKLYYEEVASSYVFLRTKKHSKGFSYQEGKLYPYHSIQQLDEANLKELRSCQLFLVDSKLERMRQRVFHYAMKLPQHSNSRRATGSLF